MTRPKLEVNEVWILERVLPYDGSEILGVFFDPEVAKDGRRGWWPAPDGSWSTAPIELDFKPFYTLTKHTIRTK